MLKQQDMTETARVVFNELSVTEPATVGEIAQNTYLSRERCQLILTQLVMAGAGGTLRIFTYMLMRIFFFGI
ncbi:TrmB family transcriptional regulator [Escherichia coli]|uniref:TrmB family transcriptional regulator n=1 Tax=Escherichia coli TaxID=562 RepID=UPI000D172832|nr:TrmB family transcriptional regulator [Escherichia coli]PSY92222.1 TrmB family transcriptional regulator [Escherichia coli]